MKNTEQNEVQENELIEKNGLTEEQSSVIELLKSVDCGIAIYDVDEEQTATIRYVSDGFCRLCGGTRKELMEAFRRDLMFGVMPEDRAGVHETFQLTYETGIPQEITYQACLLDGTARWCTLKMTLVRKENNTATLYGTFMDVTNAMKREEKLIKNEAVTEAACSFAGMWLWTWDLDTDRIHVYRKLQEDFRFPEYMENYPECVLSMKYILPQYSQKYREMVKKIKDGEEQIEFTVQIFYPDDSVHWVRYRMNAVNRDGLKSHMAICSAQPIDSEMALEARIQIEQKKQQSMEQSLVAYLLLNITKNVLVEHKAIRPGSVSMPSLIPMQEAVNAAGADIATPSEKAHFFQMHDRDRLLDFYAKGGTTDYIDFRRRLRNGNIVWVRNTLDLLRDPSTGDILAYEYCYDIHKKKMLEEIISSAIDFDYERFGSVDLLNDQITIIHSQNEHLDRTMTIRKYSEHCAEYAERLAAKDRENLLKNVSPEHVLREIEEKDVYEFVHRVPIGDGKVQVKKNRFACYDRERKICLFTRTDVTDVVEEEEKQQKELAQALEMAQKATHAKTEFLSRMSHEIRTPMNAIVGMTKLAEEAEHWEETSEYLHKIDSASEYLLGMLNDILDMSRIESGRFELHKEWISLGAVLAICVDMIQPLMAQKQIHFIHPDTSKVRTIEFYGDKLRSRQLLMNLLNNAYKFTPPGGTVILKMENVSYGDGHAVDRITVSDTGCGMSAEYMTKMFEPFEQERNPYSDLVQGTGLGLPLVKEIVSAMGGEITVTSEIGKGSTFSILFPYEYRIVDNADTQVEDTQKNNPQKNDSQETAPSKSEHLRTAAERSSIESVVACLSGKRILLVDDHPLNREIAHKLLEKREMLADEAADGKQAVDRFLEKAPDYYDAILMDIRMPVMDGLEATRAIRSTEGGKEIPIIAMTANAFYEDLERAMEAGLSAYLTKPINPEQLFGTLIEQIGKEK